MLNHKNESQETFKKSNKEALEFFHKFRLHLIECCHVSEKSNYNNLVNYVFYNFVKIFMNIYIIG